ncbi:MAG: enoyl-CoA hydratase-related protein [Burkholderiaceae bacterium]|nr:enoyl-CoA hydratase-related protein [Burkholderiaceae bacterium]
MWHELRRVFEALAGDDGVRCIVVRGAGGNFAAGADLDEFAEVHHDLDSGRRFHLETVVPSLAAIRDAPQPVLAAVSGVCAGGGLQIALACDLRIAADTARFGVPVGRLGFPVVLPELRLLLERLGQAVTAELLLTGRMLGAGEAYDRGLISRAVAAVEFEQAVGETVHAIAAGSPLAARRNKAQIRQLVESGMNYTARQLDASFEFLDSEDYREGISAFIAKRHPQFSGK